MTQWQTVLERIAGELREQAHSVTRFVGQRFGGDDEIQIVPFRGYGTARRLTVLARVIEDERIGAASPADSPWRNLVHAVKRLESDEVPGARVRITAAGESMEATSDAEGYVRASLSPAERLPADRGWHDVALELVDEPRHRVAGVRATAQVLVPPATARLGVISDIDDTIVKTDVTHLLRMARAVFFANAHTRLPFPGVAAFYQALHAGSSGDDGNPIFYVSQSPWNLYDVLSDYLELQRIPAGPLLLRDWGRAGRTTISSDRGRHKLDAIRELLKLYPHLPFILIGDSGQHDPEIYREIVHRFPRRILAVYIRNVTRSPLRASAIAGLAEEVTQAGSTLILADDTMAAARHAAKHGWIPEGSLRGIGEEREEDEAMARRDGTLDETPTLEIDAPH